MERKRDREQEIALIKELSQGRDLTELLKIHLENLASPELCDPVIRNIISVYDKAISILNFDNLVGVINPEASDQSLQDVYKKRKTVSRWTKQVRVSSETGQCHSNDGYSWRKYGQKVIMGAKFPRSYYRCTHRHVQGCLATKQVQRSDEDPSLFLISYSGKHSCVSTSTQPNHISELETKIPIQYENQFQNPSPFKDLLGFNLGPVKTEEIDSQVMTTPLFSFPSMPLDTENFDTYVFPESFEENSFLGDFKCETGEFGLTDQCFQISDSDINHEIISAQTSTTNSPIGNSNFSFDQVEFILDLPLDTSEPFS